MSSISYSAHLKPDPWLRIIVLTAGRLTFAAGMVLILTIDIAALLRGFAALLWLGCAKFELTRLQRGFSSCTAIRVHFDGRIEVRNPDGQWCSGVLMGGSLLLRKFAWLRLRPAAGPPVSELIAGNIREDHDWRRLQVIWRHVGASP